ncbi:MULTISPECIES: hypothetical protein [unclassified Shinella]|uniref:hypothetical protein n=1 Tax=unclassified Shinella TaxID=2643062 RepID=UPI00234F06A9|nr:MULTISPECIES: hypothetical protein [unclassified Shinella]MCO5139969.1 hypothetical protein [Shinella sp.]MDC7257013.1 hypothetical protein [Shinella sp. YE25]
MTGTAITVLTTQCCDTDHPQRGSGPMDHPTPTKAPIALAVIASYLILRCLWRIFVPGTEYALPPWPLVSIILDILTMIVLFILKPQVPVSGPDAPIYVRYATPLFVGGIIATAIMVLIRFSSNKGWWTGHLL